MLLELLSADEQDVVIATRRLLASVTGLGPSAGVAEFEAALGDAQWGAGALPAPGVSY